MIDNNFTIGPESWCSYDYHASVVTGENVFVLTTWSPSGGADGGGYVWTDNTRWSADTPEKPLSILPLLFYRSWVGEHPIDLRGAEMSVYLRGDGLILDDARCLFWVHAQHTRWHCTSQPLTLGDGAWAAEPASVSLQDDESLWHCSWSRDPRQPAQLTDVLGGAASYGFSFVGFSQEVRGRLAMSQFAIGSKRTT